MAANWGCIEDRDDEGKFIAYHIVPMVTIGGEAVMSAAHDLSDACPCHPNLQYGKGGWVIWDHHDPSHPGSKEKEASEKLEEKPVVFN